MSVWDWLAQLVNPHLPAGSPHFPTFHGYVPDVPREHQGAPYWHRRTPAETAALYNLEPDVQAEKRRIKARSGRTPAEAAAAFARDPDVIRMRRRNAARGYAGQR